MRINKSLLAALAATLTLGSCTDFINGFDAKSHEYKVNFEKQFGEIDPNQDWSMAAQTVANVNMPEIKGDAVISVFNGNPNASKSAKVLGRSVLKNGVGSFDFYSVKGVNDVYVQIKQGKKVVYTNRYDIKNSAIMIGDFATRSFNDEDCPTTQGTGTNDLVKYTYFDNIRSTTETSGIKYPSTDPYESENNVRSREAWVAYTKTSSATGAYGNTTYNYSPFTDESIFSFVKVTFDASKDVELKDSEHAEQNSDGTITWYRQSKSENPSNSVTQSVDVWKQEAINNYDGIKAGTYNGPWTNESLLSCFIKTPCGKDEAGATYDGLTDESTWVLKSDAQPRYIFVSPTFQYLKNVETAAADPISMSKFYSFFGDGNFFAESVSVWDGSKLGKYYDNATMRKMEEGYSVVTTENQVIELPYVFGCTAYSNQFGYIYYKAEDEDKIDPINLKHFVLIEDGRPASNIYRDGWGSAGTAVAGDDHGAANDWNYNYTYTDLGGKDVVITYAGTSDDKDKPVNCICDATVGSGIYSTSGQHLDGCYSPAERYAAIASKSFYGTTYRPMFFGEDYSAEKGTYKWPKGYKIIFWINTLSTSSDDNVIKNHPESCFTSSGGMGGHFNYSDPTINKRLLHNYQGTLERSAEELKTFGQVQAISWTIDGATFLAFGDVSNDKDLNDMVFMISAPNSDPDNTVKVAAIKWHLNYNGVHDVADGDLFDQYSLNVGANYTNPKKENGANSEPSRPGYNFKGWSTDEHATTGEKNISKTVANEYTVCYFAIWEPIAPEPDPEPQSWIFACEDLGGSFDYDFNDVVWEVSQPSTESDGAVTYGDIEVRILAAGGTLPIKLVYGNTVIGGEIHTTAFKQTASDGKFTPVNVAKGGLTEPAVLGTISTNEKMNLETLKANFKLIVNDAEGAGEFIVKAHQDGEDDKTPQILILPGGWRWPLEYKNIKSAYPKFAEWVKDSNEVNWTKEPVEELIIDNY